MPEDHHLVVDDGHSEPAPEVGSSANDAAGAEDSVQNGSFRNLFGPAQRHQRYRGTKGREETKQLLRRLTKFMDQQRSVLKGTIPAGYTYLAQLATHDLVHNPTRIPNLYDGMRASQDLRNQRLMLETLYGGGPGACPAIYRRESDTGNAERTALRLLYIPDGEAGDCFTAPHLKPGEDGLLGAYRDLPRIALDDGPVGTKFRAYGDALIADPRNDDHLIIAQLTVVFALLHNYLDEHQRAVHPDRSPRQRFLLSRKATIYIYRRILFEDLLPKLLEPTIRGAFHNDGFRLESDGDPRMTVEFAHAIFRAGHSMVRTLYDLNPKRRQQSVEELIVRRGTQTRAKIPHRDDWLIAWSQFFEVAGYPQPQKASGISPSLASPLHSDGLFGDEAHDFGGLLFADLLRGAFGGVRTVDSLIAKLKCVGVPGAASLGRANWQPLLEAWLTSSPANSDVVPLSPADVADHLQDPPLLLFVMLEAKAAAQAGSSTGFGILGSAVVAETFYTARDRTRALIEDDERTRDFIEEVLGTDASDSDVPNSMPLLVSALAERLRYQNLKNPFV